MLALHHTPFGKTDAPRGTRTRSPSLKRRVLLPFELAAHVEKRNRTDSNRQPKGIGGIDETRTRTFLIDNQAHSLCASIPNLIEEASGCMKREPRAFLRAWLTPRVSGLAGGSRTRNIRGHGAAICQFELRPT